MLMNAARKGDEGGKRRYKPPHSVNTVTLGDLLDRSGRDALSSQQLEMLKTDRKASEDVTIYYSGKLDLLCKRCVSIVGTREASREGYSRASKLARELVSAGVVVVSGLAHGIDEAAHCSAIENGGRTVGVIGTPLTKAYPAEHTELQETIWRDHLLLTPFAPGGVVYKSNFPLRNRIMAALSDATVIVEASDTSGTLHQAAECHRLGRWLFIMRAVTEDKSLQWPAKFLNKPKTRALVATEEILQRIGV